MRIPAIAALLALVSAASQAGEYPSACRGFTSFPRGDLVQPARPPCLDYLVDRVSIEICQPLMDLYQIEVRAYVDCLKSENSAIIDRFNDAAKKFNCAQNGRLC